MILYWPDNRHANGGGLSEAEKRQCDKYLDMIATPEEKHGLMADLIRRVFMKDRQSAYLVREEGWRRLGWFGRKAEYAIPRLMEIAAQGEGENTPLALDTLLVFLPQPAPDKYRQDFLDLCVGLMEGRSGSDRVRRNYFWAAYAAEALVRAYPSDAERLGVLRKFPELAEDLGMRLRAVTNDAASGVVLPK
jgi:hypothetical protein